MIDTILIQRNVKVKAKITIKSLIAVSLIVLAIALPQLVHAVAGASGGMTFLPMYLPVMLAGAILGTYWGLAVGIASPILSFLLTSLWASPMPALSRLPFMVAELAVFALVCGLFSKKIAQNKWMAFPAILFAEVLGRLSFLLLVAIFQNVSVLSVSLVWSQIKTGMLGLILQAVLVPLIILPITNLIKRDEISD